MRTFILVSAIFFASSAFAQDEIAAVIPYTSTPPTIDGMGGDDAWANSPAHTTEEFFKLQGDSPNEGDDDFSVTWKGLWDDENLYVYVEVHDDVIVNDDSLNWQDDSVEFYIDAQNLDVEDYRPDQIDPETDEELRVPAFQITGIAGCNIDEPCGDRIREDSTTVFTWGINSYDRGDPTFEEDDELVTYPRGADTSVSKIIDDNTYTYEVAFPWEALFDTPENIIDRGEMGFGIAVNDDDDGGGRDAQFMWATENGDLWRRSDVFPSVALEPKPDDTVAGDFNKNGQRDPGDLDLLAAAMASNDVSFDLTGDGKTDLADRTFWVENLANTYMGDSNFDGEFSSADFVTVFTAAKYEKGEPATWVEGDWNGDGLFSSSDFVTAFSGAGYEKGPREGGLQVVPEPSSSVLAMLAVCSLGFAIRRRRS